MKYNNTHSNGEQADFNIIKKWYEILEFDSEYDDEFNKALGNISILPTTDIETFVPSENGKRNLLSFLYMCENLKNKYREKNIPEDILIDTLKDIAIWTRTWSGLKNELYLGECTWLKRHLSMKLFKLGRLQFCMGEAETDIPGYGVKKGDEVVEIHIPETGPLTLSACEESIEKAKEFFEKYYPDFNYKCFTCHSWLLDPTLDEILNCESNIIKFKNMFTYIEKDESYAILKYIFRWNTDEKSVADEAPKSSLAKKVKEKVLAGDKFYETLGVIPKK